jgi:hypothetical protein
MRYSVGALVVSAGVIATTSLHAQCVVDKSSNEAKLLAYYAAPLAFSPSGSLGVMKAGAIRLGFEVTLIPAPGDDLRRTHICFLPKEEDSQLSPVFPRPHLTVGLGQGFFAEGMYLPPVTIMDATPNMVSLALGYARGLSARTGVALRAHTTFGKVKGPITCNQQALQSTNANGACYGDHPSEDTYKPNIVGGEAALTFQASEKLKGYLGAGISSLKPRFQVGFQPRNTTFDNTQVIVDLTRVSLELGGAYHVTPKIALAAEVYSVPRDLTTVRFGGTWNVR